MSITEAVPSSREWNIQAEDTRLPAFVCLTVVVAVVVPRIISGPNLLTFDLAVAYAIAALGLNVIFGFGGLLSVAQGAVMAVGAYALVLLLNHAGSVGVIPALALATAVGGLVSGLTGLVAIRIRSHYFILASLALSEGVLLVITNQIGLTGGSNGLGLKGTPTLLGLDLTTAHGAAYLGVALLGLVWYLASCLRSSRFGIALQAARSDDYLAMASAVAVHRNRLWATVVGGAFGGLGGGLLALLNGYIGPQDFGLDTSVLLLLMVVLGGRASNAGTVAAAIVLTAITQGLLQVTSIGDLVYGLAIVALLIFTREGLAGLGQGALGLLRRSTGAAGRRWF